MGHPVTPSSMPSAAALLATSTAAGQSRAVRALRIVFIALLVTIVALDALAFPHFLAQLTPAVIRELHRVHFPVALFGAIELTENIGYALIYLAMALLLFWRRSNDRMANFCAVMLLLFGCATTSGFLYDISVGATTPLLGNSFAIHLLILLLFTGGQMCFLLFFFLFPSGRFAPRWTRWVAALAGAYWLATVFDPTIPAGPWGNLTLLFIVAAVVAQIYRYLRVSTSVEREATKWVVFGVALGIAIVALPQIVFALIPHSALGLLVDNSPLLAGLVFGAPWIIGLALVPIFIAVAVLRSHLWDIDTLINRTLVYGALTALLAAVYLGLTVGFQRLSALVTGQAGQQPVVIVLSTLVIVALFHPLRSRIQRVIDQRFYRRKYDAARTLREFSATLRQEIDLDDLRARLLAVVDETMQPSHYTLWLRRPPAAPHERL
jgi:hypothetical protein